MRWTQEQYDEYLSKRSGAACICKQCGKEFHGFPSQLRKYCSLACSSADPDRVEHIQPKDRGTSRCEKCGKEFVVTVSHRTRRFCSQPCASSFIGLQTLSANRLKKPRLGMDQSVCASCGKQFNSWRSARRKFCCWACANKQRKGHGQYSSGWVCVGGKNIYVRSQWEANYAFFLEFQKVQKLIEDWDYESKTFWFDGIKRGVCSYLPDFTVRRPFSEEYHEVKGWLDKRSKTKLKRMAKYHPTARVVLVDSKRYKAIVATLAPMIPGWGTVPKKETTGISLAEPSSARRHTRRKKKEPK